MPAPIDIKAKIRGVKPRPATVELCTDPEIRGRIEDVISRLQAVDHVDDESLSEASLASGDDRDVLLAELGELNDAAEAAGAWMRFTLHAPSHQDRVGHMAVIAALSDDTEEQKQMLVESEARLLASSIKEVDGEAVDFDVDDALHILTEWDESLSRELIDAMNSFAPEGVSLPFSQRVSEILKTARP